MLLKNFAEIHKGNRLVIYKDNDRNKVDMIDYQDCPVKSYVYFPKKDYSEIVVIV